MSEQNWKRCWTTEEIIQNADNWTLAGDAALLNTIKHFAEQMLTDSEDVSNNINKLLQSADELQLKLDISQNEFHSLKNSQFIENRVHEEDETLKSSEVQKPLTAPLSKQIQSTMVTDTIMMGIEVMEKYYDNVEVSISDSEDELERSYILKPKDLYSHRPLPPIIGSVDWNKRWHLDDVSSESESEKISETYSDSDSEDDLPKDLNKISSSSSELDFSSVTSESRPVGSSTFNDSTKKTDFMPSSEESDGNLESHPAKTPVANKSFVEQLAAKLGNVISENEELPKEEVNKRPIKPVKNNNYIDHLFSDEPPPLDDFQDKSSAKNVHSDLFSGGQGLFDDSEDDFWEPKKLNTKQSPIFKPEGIKSDIKTSMPNTSKVESLFEEEDDEMFTSSTKNPSVILPDSLFDNRPIMDLNDNEEPKKVIKGLFEDEEVSDDIFSTSSQKPVSEKTESLFDTTSPVDKMDNKERSNTKKKPVGGVSVFASVDIFGNQNIKDILGSKQNQTRQMAAEKPIVAAEKPTITARKPIVAVEKPMVFPRSTDNIDASIKNKSSTKVVEKLTEKKKMFDIDGDSESKPTVKNVFGNDIIGNKSQTGPAASNKIINLFDENDDDFFAGITQKSMKRSKEETVQQKSDKNVEKKDSLDELFFDTSKLHSGQDENRQNTTNKKPNLFENDDLARYDLFADIPKHDDEDLFSSTSKIIDESKILISETANKNNISITATVVEDDSLPGLLKNIVKTEEMEGNIDKNGIVKDDSFDSSFQIDKMSDESKMTEKDNEDDFKIPEVVEQCKADSVEDDLFASVLDIKKGKGTEIMASKIEELSDDSSLIKDEVKDPDLKDYIPDNKVPVGPQDVSISQDQTKPSNIYNQEPKSVIGLFDSLPPTDDEADWDTKSDNFSDNDDLFSCLVTKDQQRSVFDNEPPSLDLPSPSAKATGQIRGSADVEPESPIQEPPVTKPETPAASTTDDRDRDVLSHEDKIKQDEYVGSSISDSFQRKNKENTKISAGSLDRLKQNLNINVNTLRPGFAPPKFREPSMPQDVISTTDKNQNDITPKVDADMSTSSLPILSGNTRNHENGVSFDDSTNNHEVLHSYTKDRAKIPLKRKPSTRRGRQEAIRRTATEELADKDLALERNPTMQRSASACANNAYFEEKVLSKEISKKMETATSIADDPPLKSSNMLDNASKDLDNITTKDSNREVINKSDIYNSISENNSVPCNDEKQQGLFDDPLAQLDPIKSVAFKGASNDIFEESDKEYPFSNSLPKTGSKKEELFARKPTAKQKSSLFASSDSEDDLFGKSDMKKTKDRTKTRVALSRKGLFEDSSSEDDLFASSSNKRVGNS